MLFQRSLNNRLWTLPDPATDRAGLAIAQKFDLPEIIGVALAARGVSLTEIPVFLNPSLRELMPDPSALRDMDQVTDRIASAVMHNEQVALFGDYDVDGAASVALMARWFRHFGIEATPYVPHRIDEGYGPNVKAMETLARCHDLIITLDCGTVSFEPIEAARRAGADVVVIDHHIAQEKLPECTGIVNPNRQDDDSGLVYLCAAGVALMVLASCNRALRQMGAFEETGEPNLLAALDLVALATVADVAPLRGLNRALVRQGLKVLAARQNIGLRALADAARLRQAPRAYHLGYVLGPRINAGGRVGDQKLGTALLSTDDPQEAARVAQILEECNAERRAVEHGVLMEAMAQIELRGDEEAPLVWAMGETWHPGVVGIVASRLKERYGRPAIVIGSADGRIFTGSGRSVPGIDLGTLIQRAAAEGLLLKGGGHKMAAGLSVAPTQLETAMRWLSEAIAQLGRDLRGADDLLIDGVLTPGAATLEFCEQIEQLGPFGTAAPAPRFAFASTRLASIGSFGEKHLKCRLSGPDGASLEATCFNAIQTPMGRALLERKGQSLHFAGRLEINEWNGRQSPRLMLEDVALPP